MKKSVERALVNLGLHDASVFEYDVTDSTNTRAKLFAKSRDAGLRTPAIFLSRAQSAGRGTRGRSFESPDGGGVYVSYLIYRKMPPAEATKMTAAAAVAVCRVLDRYRAGAVGIKWVNDVYADGKKLAGILTEGVLGTDGMLDYAIIGIGINTRPAPHSDEVRAIMTTLADEGISVDDGELCAGVTEELLRLLDALFTEELAMEYRKRSLLLGKRVMISSGGRTAYERVIEIDDELALVTEDGDGRINKYISGDVSVITSN